MNRGIQAITHQEVEGGGGGLFYWGGLICWGKHKKKIFTRGILYEQGINIYRIVLLLLSTVVLAPHRLFRQ